MSYNSREIDAAPDLVFAVLADPHTYPAWLVGNAEVRSVDSDWPRPGSRFRHRVGVWPLTIADSTELAAIEPGRSLRLKVRARPLIRAVAIFRIVSDGTRTVVSLEEEPAVPIVGAIVRPFVDPLTHLRNHASLRRLASFIESAERDRAASAAR
jgi:uncharacterized protein YndB with AHSA1/START domain